MVVIIDIGNTNTHMGIYKSKKLMETYTIPTSEKFDSVRIKKLFEGKQFEGAAIASVVPALTTNFVSYFRKNFCIAPIIISSKLNMPIKFDYYKPETLGADRIANVVGGLEKYRKDLLIIDFGTATTFDVVFKDGNYAGGIIFPGVKALLLALTEKTALLPNVALKKPLRLIGRSTEECIRSGIFYGTVALVKGIINRLKEEGRSNLLCISTGGWGKMMTSLIPEIARYDPNLCLYGILKIYYYNV